MRYASTFDKSGAPVVAELQGDQLVPLAGLTELGAATTAEVLAGAQRRTADAFPAAGAELRAVVPNPAKVICIGLNYKAHIEETGRTDSDYPVLFPKFASSLTGPYAALDLPRESAQVDYEGELAVVIGKPGRRISEADAAGHVLGYTVANDISMRDYQYKTHQWMQGKAWDECTPLGPYLVTRGRGGHHRAVHLHHRQRREGAGLHDLAADLPHPAAHRHDLRVHRAAHRRRDPHRHPVRRRGPAHPAAVPQVGRRGRRRGDRRRRAAQHRRLMSAETDTGAAPAFENLPPRLDLIAPADLDDAQRAVYDAITGGPRASQAGTVPITDDAGRLLGPFAVMLLTPEVGNAMQQVGAKIRFAAALTARERELAILTVAGHLRSDFERLAHEPAARTARPHPGPGQRGAVRPGPRRPDRRGGAGRPARPGDDRGADAAG